MPHRVSPISVPYPQVTARELRISADACQLHLRPGAGTEWVADTYQDPSGQRSPTLTQDGGTSPSTTSARPGRWWARVAGDPRFDLQVGTGPAYALTIQAAAIQTDAELGGLPSPG